MVGSLGNARSSALVRIGRLIFKLPLSFLRAIEYPFIRSAKTGDERLVVILALPRSGSTLTYQSVIHSTASQYVSNIWHLLHKAPLIGGYLSKYLCRGHQSDFRSSQGFVPGLCGPAEALHFWKYWFGLGLSDHENEKSSRNNADRRRSYLKKVINRITKNGNPLVTAYLGHVLDIKLLKKEFPNAVFIRLARDPISNGLSILKCRRANGNTWFSLCPRECDEVSGQGEIVEVASQVYWLNKRIDESIDRKNTIFVRYEDLCENPGREISRIIDFANKSEIAMNAVRPLPASFRRKSVDLNRDPDAKALNAEIRILEEKHGELQCWYRAKTGGTHV